MAAITTLATLKAAVANALVRSDFTERIAEAVPLAEAWLNRNLRLRLMESEVVLSATPGAATVALPIGFLEPLGLSLNHVDNTRFLVMRTRGEAEAAGAGPPSAFWIDGANIVFDRPCDAAYGLTLHMLQRFTLIEDDDSNALLVTWPDLYLSAVLVAVCGLYLTDDPRLGGWKVGRDELLAEVMRKEARSKARAELRAEPSMLHGAASRTAFVD